MTSVFKILTRREVLTQPLSNFSKNLLKSKLLASVNKAHVPFLMFHNTPHIAITCKKTREEWTIFNYDLSQSLASMVTFICQSMSHFKILIHGSQLIEIYFGAHKNKNIKKIQQFLLLWKNPLEKHARVYNSWVTPEHKTTHVLKRTVTCFQKNSYMKDFSYLTPSYAVDETYITFLMETFRFCTITSGKGYVEISTNHSHGFGIM